MLPNLMRPSEFQRRNPDIFPSYDAMHYHLKRRRENGLLKSGAVVETAIGLRIDTERFPQWFLGK